MLPNATRPGKGRRSDPDIEPRVLAATLELYGEVGWARLNLDMVARRAGVGKAALYRRWSTMEELIAAALASRMEAPEALDTGSLRGDLLALATTILERTVTADGLVDLRSVVEAKIYPEVFGQALESQRREQIRVGREIVLRAIERGELPAGTSPALILDAVAGTLMHHFLMTPAEKIAALKADGAQYVERVVDFVLSAAGYRPQ